MSDYKKHQPRKEGGRRSSGNNGYRREMYDAPRENAENENCIFDDGLYW